MIDPQGTFGFPWDLFPTKINADSSLMYSRIYQFYYFLMRKNLAHPLPNFIIQVNFVVEGPSSF